MDTNTTQPQVDPTALALSRSIRRAEGGDYNNVSGDNGTSAGAYQFNNGKIPLQKGQIPANFQSWAKELNLDPNDFSETNQDHVAYEKIKKDLDSGLTQSQIAAKWNSGLTHGWENHVGDVNINGKTIHYDTPGYVNKVKGFYEQEMQGKGLSNNQSGKTNGFITSANLPTPEAGSGQEGQPNTGVLGTNKGDSTFGKIVDNSLTRGLENVVPGAKTLGESIGTLGGLGYEKLKGVFGGEDNSKYYDTSAPSVLDTAIAGAKTVGTATTIAGAGGLIGKLISQGKALASPALAYHIPMELSEFKALSSVDKLETLTQALKGASSSGSLILRKAIEEITPTAAKELGLAPSVLKQTLTKGGGLIGKLIKGIGNTAVGVGLGVQGKSIYDKIVR